MILLGQFWLILRFGTVKIYQTDDGKVVGNVTSPAGTYDCLARAIICLSGPIQEQKLTGVSFDEQPGSFKDILMAREALSRTGMDGLDIHSIVPFTKMMLGSRCCEPPEVAAVPSQAAQC
jgi:hypothetical protein